MSDLPMNPLSVALEAVGFELNKAVKESRQAYEFAPSSYTASAMQACLSASEAYQRWCDLQQKCGDDVAVTPP